MRNPILMLLALVLFGYNLAAIAQSSSNPSEQAQKLRAELSQLHDREAEIKIRLTELEYDLKPENIERHFAGVGSIHPEELREARRDARHVEGVTP